MNITDKEVADFIREQPDDKTLNMKQNFNGSCGCLLIQLAKSQGFSPSEAGYNQIHLKSGPILRLSGEVGRLIRNLLRDNQPINYKQLRQNSSIQFFLAANP